MLSVLVKSSNLHQDTSYHTWEKRLKLHLSMHYKHVDSTDSYTYLPTDSALVRAYEHILTQNKNNMNIIIYLNVVMKKHCWDYWKQYLHFCMVG